YMLLITVIGYLWQGIAKEQVDFFKMASNNTTISMKYDYLYTAIVNAESLCGNSNSSCSSGMSVNLPNYKFSHTAKVCKYDSVFYAFYNDAILTQKPPVSLASDAGFSLISVKDVPAICKDSNNTNEDNYALKKN
ncbi:hypothetical protein FQY55_004798, partial [Escherichia coli]|nr:hypothetical protein [Escherichia coli]